MKFRKSATSPIGIVATLVREPLAHARPRLSGTNTRDDAEHFWPWNSNDPRTTAADQRAGVGGGVRNDEVLAARLADQAAV